MLCHMLGALHNMDYPTQQQLVPVTWKFNIKKKILTSMSVGNLARAYSYL